LSDATTTELHVEHALHRAQDLLIGSGGTALKVLNDGNCGVALSGEFLLRHLVALLVAALLDGVGDFVADGLGLDDVVTAIDLGQVLAFGGTGLGRLSRSISRMVLAEKFWGNGEAYDVASGVLLLGS